MPSTSSTTADGKLARWLVKEGDKIKAGDVVAEIETDKATMEFEAPIAGTLFRILVPEGSEAVKVGAPIGIIATDGDSSEDIESVALPAAAGAKAPAQKAPVVAAGFVAASNSAERAASSHGPQGRIFASPVARVIARQNNLDLRLVEGTGPHQRIVKADVERFLRTSTQGAQLSSLAPAMVETVALASALTPIPMPWQQHQAVANSSMRKIIARRLLQSKQTAPHFYLTSCIDLEQLLAARARLNAKLEASQKLSVNDFFIKASALALRQVPEANAMWTDEAVLKFDDVDISVAVATDGGLITPVIRNADKKGLIAISGEMKELAARARANKLKPEEFQGGGFSVSNLGMYGVEQFAAIINPPQSCILALGASEKRAVVRDNSIVVRTVLTATLSVDHRSVDGAVGARLLAAIKSAIEEPVSMIL